MKHISLRRHLTVAVLFILPLFLVAQEDRTNSIAYLYEHEGKDSMTILADTAYIRDKPSTAGKKLASLPAGTKVWAGAVEQEQRISGFNAAWVSVKCIYNGQPVQGYLWQGLLALGAYERGGWQFLYGVDHALTGTDKDDIHYFASAKVLNAAKHIVAGKTWQLGSSYSMTFSEGKVLGGMGLDSVLAIMRVHFSGEACGIPDDYYYFGWNGTELLPLPGKTSVSDAGVFYHGEELLFPSEKGGAPGKIIRLIEDEEATEKTDRNGEPVMKKSQAKETYSWDGRKAVKL